MYNNSILDTDSNEKNYNWNKEITNQRVRNRINKQNKHSSQLSGHDSFKSFVQLTHFDQNSKSNDVYNPALVGIKMFSFHFMFHLCLLSEIIILFLLFYKSSLYYFSLGLFTWYLISVVLRYSSSVAPHQVSWGLLNPLREICDLQFCELQFGLYE